MYPSSQLFETYCKPQLSSLESEVTYWYDHSQVKSHSYLQSEYQKQFQNKLNCPTPLFTPNQPTRPVDSVVFFLGCVTSWDGVHGVVGADTGFHTRALGGTEEIKTGDYVLVRAEAVHNDPLFKWCGIEVQVVDKTFTTVDKNFANQPKLPIFLNPPPSLPRALDPEVPPAPPAPRISKPDNLSLSKSERPKKRKRESYYVNDRHSGGSRSTHTSRYEEKFRTSSRKKEKKDSRRRNYKEHNKYSTKKHRHSDSKKRKLNKEVVSDSSGTSSPHETKYIRKSQSRNEDDDEIESQKIVQNENTEPTQEPDDVPRSSNVEQTDTFANDVESLSENNDNMLNKNSAIPASRDSLENFSPEDNLVACVDITNFNEEIEATMKYLDELLPGIFLKTPDPTIPISMTEIKEEPSNEIATELNRDLAEGIDITNSISNEIPAETTNDAEEKCDNDLVVEQSNESAEELTADDLILTISTIGQPMTPLSTLLLGENVSGRLSPIENINTLIECSPTNEDEDVNSLEEGEIASSSEDYENETNERDSVSDTLNVQELPNRITKDLTITETGTVIGGPWNFNPEEPWGRKSKMRSDYPSEWKPVTRKTVRKVVTRIERSRTRDEIAYQPEYFSSDGNGHLYWSESRYSSDDDERTYDEDTNVWVRKNSGN